MAEKITHRLPYDKAKDWPLIVDHNLRTAYKQWGKDLIFQLKPDEESRSQRQNRLLWMWHGEFAAHIEASQGQIFDTNDIHEFIAGKLLPRRAVTMPDGEPVIVRQSTSKLGVKDFAEMLNKYEMLCADSYGLNLTRPDDLYWSAMMREDNV